MIEVDRDDPAFGHPTKPIGPVYDWETAERLKATSGWVIAADGDKFRRVVASPKPKRIFEIGPIRSLVDHGTIVICAGGGGIPTMYDEHGHLRGVEAVIDKDLAAALLAEQLEADLLVIATDVDAVYTDWGKPNQARLAKVTPDELVSLELPAGSMGPKVQAACGFARVTGNEAVIGSLADIADIVLGNAGTRVKS
jgi:carbamate kinase